jgi:hypothetical protein
MDVRERWEISEDDPFEILHADEDSAIHISWFWRDSPVEDLEAQATEMVEQLPANRENLAFAGYTVFRDDSAVGVWADLDPTEAAAHAWGVGSWAWPDAVMVMSWIGAPTLGDHRETALLMFAGVERVGHFANPH